MTASRAALLIATLAAGTAGSALAGGHATPRNGAFHTPSRNIVCAWGLGDKTHASFLRCDIRSGLTPSPNRPRGCPADIDYGQGLELVSVPRRGQQGVGRAGVVCAGDTVLGERGSVLAYGKVFGRGGITCVSRRSGLTCLNGAGRGFFLSRERWRIF